MEYISNTVADTHNLARRLGALVVPGTVLVLAGPLGAGKTSFVQGLAKGMGVQGIVNSPTFTIIKEYSGRLPLYHFDFYRLQASEELWELGFDEYLRGGGVCALEWGERFMELLPRDHLQIAIDYRGALRRRLRFVPCGADHLKLLKELDGNVSAGN